MRFVVVIILLSLAGCAGKSGTPFPVAAPANIGYPEAPAAARQSIAAPRLLIRGVTLIDGTGAPARAGVDIAVDAGTITAVGAALPATGYTLLDGAGLTALPGLIDAHTHLAAVPGAFIRGDDAALVEREQVLQLRAYLASGVTALLDTAIGSATLARLQARAAAGDPAPEIHHLAPYLTPAGGYFASPVMRGAMFADLWPPVTGAASLHRYFAAAATAAPTGVKVTVEDGMVFPVWPLFNDAQLAQIRDAAAAAHSPVFVHSMTNAEHRKALLLKPYAFVHAGCAEEDVAPDVLAGIRGSGAYVITTVAVYPMEGWTRNPAALNQAWIRARVPQVQYETAVHPDVSARSLDVQLPAVKPWWAPGALVRLAAPLIATEKFTADSLAGAQRAVKAMYDAGIPLVVGADEGNWPAFATLFHGVGTVLEMELLEQAGIPRGEIILAATSRSARMLGQAHRVGTLAPGMQADIVLLPRNPLDAGMSALHEPAWVIKGGVAKTPAAWLHD